MNRELIFITVYCLQNEKIQANCQILLQRKKMRVTYERITEVGTGN